MHSTSAIIPALIASVVAVPTASTIFCKNPTYQDANFDDLIAVPGTAGNIIPIPYKGLEFQGFTYSDTINTGTGVVPGVFPHSGTNYAASSARTTTLMGSAEFTTQYTNSNVSSFDLYSLYYGCVLSLENGAAALPTPCNIAVTGFAFGDNSGTMVQVAAQEFSYNPSTTTGSAQQTQVIFNSFFRNLQYVLVQYTLPGGTATLSVDLTILFDDIMYKTCST